MMTESVMSGKSPLVKTVRTSVYHLVAPLLVRVWIGDIEKTIRSGPGWALARLIAARKSVGPSPANRKVGLGAGTVFHQPSSLLTT